MKKLQQIRELRKCANHLAYFELADTLYKVEQKRCLHKQSDEDRALCHAINGPTCLLASQETV